MSLDMSKVVSMTEVFSLPSFIADRFSMPESPDISQLSAKQLRQLAAIRCVSLDGCFEKSELVQRLHDHYTQSAVDVGPEPDFDDPDWVPPCVFVLTSMIKSAGHPPSARFQAWLRAEAEKQIAPMPASTAGGLQFGALDADELSKLGQIGMFDIALQRKLSGRSSARASVSGGSVPNLPPKTTPAPAPLVFDVRKPHDWPAFVAGTQPTGDPPAFFSTEPKPASTAHLNFPYEVPPDPDLSATPLRRLRRLLDIRGLSSQGIVDRDDLVQRLLDDYKQKSADIGDPPEFVKASKLHEFDYHKMADLVLNDMTDVIGHAPADGYQRWFRRNLKAIIDQCVATREAQLDEAWSAAQLELHELIAAGLLNIALERKHGRGPRGRFAPVWTPYRERTPDDLRSLLAYTVLAATGPEGVEPASRTAEVPSAAAPYSGTPPAATATAASKQQSVSTTAQTAASSPKPEPSSAHRASGRSDSTEQPGGKVCWACGSSGKTFKCSRCLEARYCSADCQKAHWKEHKPDCVKKAA